MAYKNHVEINDGQFEEHTVNYHTAIKESYLKGVADLYYAALLMLCKPQRMQEAVELMKVSYLF